MTVRHEEMKQILKSLPHFPPKQYLSVSCFSFPLIQAPDAQQGVRRRRSVSRYTLSASPSTLPVSLTSTQKNAA